ncbi:hypothetical protein F4604DRAFT_1684637 [Suillus subluteus]|nr:hypothetical protein F4604DRAFT_1684637 [Suillus subluteus]
MDFTILCPHTTAQCTALDRLTGGSTLLFHHPGATVPGSDITPELLKAEVYVNPRVLGEDINLHQAVAEMSQIFIEQFATPLTHQFAASHTLNNWPTSSASSMTPSHPPSTQSNLLPLIPVPVSRALCHFQVCGHPAGSLAQIIGLNSVFVSSVPQGSPLTWVAQAVPVTPISTIPSRPRASPGAKKTQSQKSPVVVYDFDSDDDGYPDPGPITPTRAKSSLSTTVSKQPASTILGPITPIRASSSSSMTVGKQPASTIMSCPYLFSASQGVPYVLILFGPETEKAIETLRLPDTLHAICIEIKQRFLTKQWALMLTEEGHISMEDAEAISEAMLSDALTPLFGAIFLGLDTSMEEARENQRMGIKYNSSSDRRSKMVEIINDRAEYSSLMEEEKEELVKEFNEVKKHATNRPPNITPHVKETEGAKSFQAIKDELDALSQCAGIEAFIFMVRSKSDFQMAPKAYFTSPECEQFTCVYLQHDAARTATNFESVMLSRGLLNSAPSNHKDRVSRAKSAIRTGLRESLCEVTNDTSATVEFMKYEASVVRRYHVKLMGWNHPQWANPSDLKGSVEALKRLADAIKAKTYHFVEINPVLHAPSDDLSCVTRNSRLAPNDTDKVIESTLHAPRNTPTPAIEPSIESRTVNNHHCKCRVETDENEEPQPHAKQTRKLTTKQVALEEEARERSAAQGKSKSRKKNT